jgi:hypothetical protein
MYDSFRFEEGKGLDSVYILCLSHPMVLPQSSLLFSLPPPGTTPSNIHDSQILRLTHSCLARGDVDMWKIIMYSFKYGAER